MPGQRSRRTVDLKEARRLVDAGPTSTEGQEVNDPRWIAAAKALGVYPDMVPMVPSWQSSWVDPVDGQGPSVKVKRPRDLESWKWGGGAGGLLHYPSGDVEWKPAFIFEATLRIMSYARGRSAAYLYLYTAEGVQYPMFLSFFNDMVEKVELHRGYVHAAWTFAKRGENYSIRMHEVLRPSWEVQRTVRTEKCFLDTCDKTSEVDEGSNMALEPGWLSEGRGEARRFFCGQEDRVAFLRTREAKAVEGV